MEKIVVAQNDWIKDEQETETDNLYWKAVDLISYQPISIGVWNSLNQAIITLFVHKEFIIDTFLVF